jgi:hypothetical protein
MPLQNRVQPDGTIIVSSARGTFTGNRGILHDPAKSLLRRWSHPHWITCSLHWKNVRRVLMSPNRWTELFFLDECVALAAGHRPCAYCRRADYERWCAAWKHAFGARMKAPEMDRLLHASRIDTTTRMQRRHTARISTLPDGTFILHRDQPHLVFGETLLPYSAFGYQNALPRPDTVTAEVMTPAVTVAVLKAGYRPAPHDSSQVN